MTAIALAIPPTSTLSDLLWSRPDYWGGRPCIAGSGITVGRIGIYYREGCNAEQIWTDRLDKAVSLAHVHAALAFYLANQAVVDADLDEQDRECERFAAEYKAANPRP